MAKRSSLPLFVIAGTLIALLTVAAAVLLRPSAGSGGKAETPPLAGASIGGPFNLIDQNGKPFTDRDLIGHYALVYFGYTFCPDVCPTDVARMMQGLKLFEKQDPARAAKVLPVFFTIDPGRDTPAAMKEFVNAFHPRLVGLTGSQAQVDKAIEAYHIYAKKEGPADATAGYLMDHSANGYLFDTQGHPMLLFAADDTPQAIAAMLDKWVK